MARLFLALWPGPTTRRQLAHWRDRCRWPTGAAVVATAKLHLTLHFIGEVDDARVPAITQGLRVPVPPPFDLCLDTAAPWPRGLAVLESSAPPQALVGLHAALADALRTLDLPVERRRFTPHVTLARRAAGAVLAPASPLAWRVTGYALVRSAAGAGASGDGYAVLRRYA